MNTDDIISYLPYQNPFLFVDDISEITEQGVKGQYTFDKSSWFYKGHFKNNPVTPGVIITECMAQIGLVCLGIFLMRDNLKKQFPKIALTSNQVDFYLPVLPGESVFVQSDKEVFRFNKLKCKVQMFNQKQQLVARGQISGMLTV